MNARIFENPRWRTQSVVVGPTVLGCYRSSLQTPGHGGEAEKGVIGLLRRKQDGRRTRSLRKGVPDSEVNLVMLSTTGELHTSSR